MCQLDVYGSLRHWSTVPYLILHHGQKVLKDEYTTLTNPLEIVDMVRVGKMTVWFEFFVLRLLF